MLTRDEIFTALSDALEEMFEISPADISLSATLFEDLDLDSIDAVDLVIKLQQLTGKKISPEDFKTVRTVGDIVDQVSALVQS
ncbi:MAG: acyl carrier protein [Immundisolibacteraceae bacterium]|nr:acyl carrier protein [Immundisolibacteraceae bacterium]